jgi:hypothetical protein
MGSDGLKECGGWKMELFVRRWKDDRRLKDFWEVASLACANLRHMLVLASCDLF